MTEEEAASWSAPGPKKIAAETYAKVKQALEADVTLRSRNIEIFLQGSYANATNLTADSDVDIVAMSKRTFHSEKSALSLSAKIRYDQHYPDATYHANQHRAEVQRALERAFGGRVKPRNKCIKVAKAPGMLDADVVPSFQYRHYVQSDPADFEGGFIEEIIIDPADGSSRIVNFPKEHINNGETKNGETKNGQTKENYKKTVRQIKHLRRRAVAEGRLTMDEAPGYLLECLVFNLPDYLFVNEDLKRLQLAAYVLHDDSDLSNFKSCDKVHTLFGTDPGNFGMATGKRIAKALWETV